MDCGSRQTGFLRIHGGYGMTVGVPLPGLLKGFENPESGVLKMRKEGAYSDHKIQSGRKIALFRLFAHYCYRSRTASLLEY